MLSLAETAPINREQQLMDEAKEAWWGDSALTRPLSRDEARAEALAKVARLFHEGGSTAASLRGYGIPADFGGFGQVILFLEAIEEAESMLPDGDCLFA